MMTRDGSHDLRQKIDLYLDNALSEREQQDLLSKVNSDPDCCQMFNNEKCFRDFIKNNVRKTCSKDLVQTIRDRIQSV